jgi:hypothetical protein
MDDNTEPSIPAADPKEDHLTPGGNPVVEEPPVVQGGSESGQVQQDPELHNPNVDPAPPNPS